MSKPKPKIVHVTPDCKDNLDLLVKACPEIKQIYFCSEAINKAIIHELEIRGVTIPKGEHPNGPKQVS